ncbi:MAG TPA: choline-sulfatase, partial [Bacteroidales bacterium]|nr:choline-sulfatase [Bacteroidales bacterium]
MKCIAVNIISVIYLILFTFLPGCTSQNKKNASPNILFIFADDQSYTTKENNVNDIITPNLDKLSERGLTFTHAYNMGGWNGAICVASRAMLNTGRFLWR